MPPTPNGHETSPFASAFYDSLDLDADPRIQRTVQDHAASGAIDQVWENRAAFLQAAFVGFIAYTALFRWFDDLASFAGSSVGQVLGLGGLGAIAFFLIYFIIGTGIVHATAICALALAFGAAAGTELRPAGTPSADQALSQLVSDRVGIGGCQSVDPPQGSSVIAELTCDANGDGSVTVVYYSFSTPDQARSAFSGAHDGATVHRYGEGHYAAGDTATIWISPSSRLIAYSEGGPTGTAAVDTWWGGL